jgi:tetratricopeptide (TPR) repeat protein
VLAGLAVYYNTFSAPFIFDDLPSISANPTIHHLTSIGQVLSPPREGETVSGRPLLNLSLAINYAVSGMETWSYHALNLAIHILNGLLLFGVLRRTFLLPSMGPRLGRASFGLAMAIALVWTVHPLQTESVTYVIQRAESLAAMFYLATLYATIRGTQSRRAIFWYAAAVGTCLLGAATKETVATAPLVVLLYDRTFLTGSFRESLGRRWGLYAGLAASWILLAGLTASTGLLGLRAENGAPSIWAYARSQPGVILYYLGLAIWPNPLCLDYGWPVARTWGAIVPAAVAVSLLVGVTVVGLAGHRRWGFAGACFFLILAPTSSVLPLGQLAFEHRMYLPLAAVVTLLVLAIYVVGAELRRRGWLARWGAVAGGVSLVAIVAIVLGLLTIRRNADYQGISSIWQDTLDKAPQNADAHYGMANALVSLGRTAEAIEHFECSLRLKPEHAPVHNNFGLVLVDAGRVPEAIEHYREALRIKPNYPAACNNLGLALAGVGRVPEAIEAYRKGLLSDSRIACALHCNLGVALASIGRITEAIEQYEQALRINPEYAEAHHNLGIRLAEMGRTDEAIEHYRRALQIKPGYSDARLNLGILLAGAGRVNEALEEFEEGTRLQPDDARLRFNVGITLIRLGRYRDAIAELSRAIGGMPDHVGIHRGLGWLLATQEPSEGGDPTRAVELTERACRLPGGRDAAGLDALAAAYASAGRFADAVATANAARRLAESAGQDSLAQEIHMRLQLYRDRKPYREAFGKPAPSGR